MSIQSLLSLWSSAWPAGLTMLGLGTGFAVVLLIASEKLKVEVDPKLEQIHQALPNLDCGACGFAGCRQYAKALLRQPELLGKCAPGGPRTAAQIAEILNLQVSDSGPAKRPIVRCRAGVGDKTYWAEYRGSQSCLAANALPNAQACTFGCLGFGDCVRACKFGALSIVDGLATIDYDKCTGCGACVQACPRNLIQMVPFASENMVVVACNSREAGKVTRVICKVGCIGCGLCAKQSSLFSVQENLASVDYDHYRFDEAVDRAMSKCPTSVIVLRGKSADAGAMTQSAGASDSS